MQSFIHRPALVLFSVLWLVAAGPLPADEERVLNFYNWADYIGSTTLPDFAREFGVHVNYDLYNATDVVDAKLLSGNTGYDVVLQAARYSARLIPLGLFLPLDKQRLPNWENLDPWVLEVLARHDPGNRHTVPYMWGTTGFLYNRRMIEERLPGAPVDSARMLFDPDIARHFADCGISMLESSTTVIPMVMLYLGHDPSSVDPQQLAEAEAQLKSVRPYIRYFSSDRAINEMPTEDLCIAMAWSGDYGTARKTVSDAGADVDLGFTVPKEGTVLFFDTLAIPADAPHPGVAHEFLNYLMRPR